MRTGAFFGKPCTSNGEGGPGSDWKIFGGINGINFETNQPSELGDSKQEKNSPIRTAYVGDLSLFDTRFPKLPHFLTLLLTSFYFYQNNSNESVNLARNCQTMPHSLKKSTNYLYRKKIILFHPSCSRAPKAAVNTWIENRLIPR